MGTGLRGENSLQKIVLDIVDRCGVVFLETYTSGPRNELSNAIERISGKQVILLSREEVEHEDKIIYAARKEDVSLLVVGDALTATTHNQLRLSALDSGIDVTIIEAPSIITSALSILGLQIYKLGRVVSLPFVTEKFFPRSPYDKITENMERELHTIILLDLTKSGFMSIKEAFVILESMNERFGGHFDFEGKKICVVHAYGTKDQALYYATFPDLARIKYSENPSTIVIPGKLDFTESAFLKKFTEPR